MYGVEQEMTFPCGKCVNCLQNKRQQWVFRLLNELKVSESCYFVTLTYDDFHLPRDELGYPQLCKRDVQLFLKRLRKAFPECKIRYFLCGEYGSHTYRPHYHAIMFNLPLDNTPHRIKLTQKIEKIWQNGHVDIGDTVGGAAINYCAKYIMTKHKVSPKYFPPFILTSRRPGLGANYVQNTSIKNYHRNDYQALASTDGCNVNLPRFYATKIFNRDELKERFITNKGYRRYKELEERCQELREFDYMSEEVIVQRNINRARAEEETAKLKERFLTKTRINEL